MSLPYPLSIPSTAQPLCPLSSMMNWAVRCLSLLLCLLRRLPGTWQNASVKFWWPWWSSPVAWMLSHTHKPTVLKDIDGSEWLPLYDGPGKKGRISQRALEMFQQMLEKLLSTSEHRHKYQNEWRVCKGTCTSQEEKWYPSRRAVCFPRGRGQGREGHKFLSCTYEKGLGSKTEIIQACSGPWWILLAQYPSPLWKPLPPYFPTEAPLPCSQTMQLSQGHGVPSPALSSGDCSVIQEPSAEHHIIPGYDLFLK